MKLRLARLSERDIIFHPRSLVDKIAHHEAFKSLLPHSQQVLGNCLMEDITFFGIW